MTSTNVPVLYKLAVLYRCYISELFTAPSSGLPHQKVRNMKERQNTNNTKCIIDALVGVTSGKCYTECALCEAGTKVFVEF